MVDFPCTCGHLYIVHPSVDNAFLVCDGCFTSNRPAGIRQLNSVDCSKYKSDNLKYLESLHENKVKNISL